MNKDELFSLINAGFTKEDILKLNASKEFNETPKDEKTKNENPKSETEKEDVKKDVEEKKEVKSEEKEVGKESTSSFSNMFDEMNSKIESLTKAIHSSNIKGDDFGESSKKTTDDIISSIIMPNRKEN